MHLIQKPTKSGKGTRSKDRRELDPGDDRQGGRQQRWGHHGRRVLFDFDQDIVKNLIVELIIVVKALLFHHKILKAPLYTAL